MQTMIFPKLRYEKLVQVNDKFRLDASATFTNLESGIVRLEIEMNEDDTIDITQDRYVDWAYQHDGEYDVKLIVTCEDSLGDEVSKEQIYTISVISEEDDALLSDDSDLYPFEPTIHRYLPRGKDSFIYAHRAAQASILAYLDERGLWNGGRSYTKEDLASYSDPEVKEQFRAWSTAQALLIIFESSQVVRDDIFQEKREEYEMMVKRHRSRSALRLGDNGNVRNIKSTRMIFR